ncbi:MAG: DUF3422 family protein, partial [Alphaproteobacteria bacterium]
MDPLPSDFDHPLRHRLAAELHARPAPRLRAPCHAVFLALKIPRDAANRDREADRRHLIALLDRYGANHPPEGADHYFGEVGRYQLRWENHTEFVTYTMFVPGVAEIPYDPDAYDVFPRDWLLAAPGKRLTSAFVRCEPFAPGQLPDPEVIRRWFSEEHVAMSRTADGQALVATDFMIDPSGHIRFFVGVEDGVSERRLGRLVTRLLEIEAYKAMALLGLPRAQEANRRVNALDVELARQVERMREGDRAEDTLAALMSISAEIEDLVARSAYRFSASRAYGEIVRDRIRLLREQRVTGRQTVEEFMTRRFEPAMRTIASAAERLDALATRAKRAGDLLSTRVDVERTAQNQKLLEAMNRRAALQLRLQHTVEGFSIIALSYYAVNLAAYLAYP